MSSSPAFDLENEFSDRFWFWNGASGQRYIHSVYHHDDCPPLPGAIFIEVIRMADGTRKALRAGRFAPFWDMPMHAAARLDDHCREVHVHLLADGDSDAARVLDDLRAGLDLAADHAPAAAATRRGTRQPSSQAGFKEPVSLPLFAGLAA